MAGRASNKLLHAALVLIVLVLSASKLVEAEEEIFEAGAYRAVIDFPEVKLYSVYPDGSVYEDQYLHIAIDSIHEGTVVAEVDQVTFTTQKQYSPADIRQNLTVSRWSDTVALSDGNVTANRQVLSFSSLLHDGGNFTFNFEIYDADGTMAWGPRYVNISANRFKYSAFASNWTFGAPENRLRATITGTYVGGNYDVPIPSFNKIDWAGPTRRIEVAWPQVGPLTASLSSDVWAVGDGNATSMPLKPNPTRDPGYIHFSSEVPKNMSCTFGFILPPFSDYAAWDPSVLMSLFTPDVPQQQVPQAKDNFTRNSGIIAGSVVGAVVIATAAIAGAIYKIKYSNNARSSRAIAI